MVIKQRAILDEDKQLRRQSILCRAAPSCSSIPTARLGRGGRRRAASPRGRCTCTSRPRKRSTCGPRAALAPVLRHARALLARERSRPSLKRLNRNVVEAIRQNPAFLPLAIQCPRSSAMPTSRPWPVQGRHRRGCSGSERRSRRCIRD
jgi:hypothetical protein